VIGVIGSLIPRTQLREVYGPKCLPPNIDTNIIKKNDAKNIVGTVTRMRDKQL
jgi:hypothetical protein